MTAEGKVYYKENLGKFAEIEKSSKTWVMITGPETIEEALQAAEFGADAIGILVETPTNSVNEETAIAIRKSLPRECESILVTHLTDTDKIIRLVNKIKPKTLQLHANSTPDDIRAIKKALPNIMIMKAINVPKDISLAEVELKVGQYIDLVDRISLDSIKLDTNQIGGTGKTHDWNIDKAIVEHFNKPVILAGGLNSSNIQSAIEMVKPFGVDVSSGVKDSSGKQDKTKLEAFISKTKDVRRKNR